MNTQSLVSFDDTRIAFNGKSDKELRNMKFLFSLMNQEHLTKICTNFLKIAIKLHFPVNGWLKDTIFKQFCGGETMEETIAVVNELASKGIASFIDYSAENVSEEKEFEETIHVLLGIIKLSAQRNGDTSLVIKLSSFSNTILLEKIQEGDKLTAAEEADYQKVKERLELVCSTACEAKVKVFIDAEESWIQGTIESLVFPMMSKYNKDCAWIFNTYQMYRSDMLEILESAITVSKIGHFHLGVKLVRGAYLEKEKERAFTKGIPSSLHNTKQDTDNDFNKSLKICIDNINTLELCCGTHNEDSCNFLMQLMDIKMLPREDKRITFSQLYGMGDHITYNLALGGYHVSKYIPFGPLEKVIPYLIRRASENASILGKSSRELKLIKKEIKRREETS